MGLKDKESLGYKKCKMLYEIMKNNDKIEFSKAEIELLIARHIGLSKLSRDRYFAGLIAFGLIQKLENGNYAPS
jgi:hypothetical protein